MLTSGPEVRRDPHRSADSQVGHVKEAGRSQSQDLHRELFAVHRLLVRDPAW